jgi:hypothetical protein
LRRIRSTHTCDVFQSSWTSWSSKIIALGTEARNGATSGSVHELRYSSQYSSKSATSSPGSPSVSRRERMNSIVAGSTSSA